MKIKFDNWRDQHGSELERAKKIVADRNTSLINLSKLTHIPYQTLKNYSSKPKLLDKASWKRIHMLSNFYDAYLMTNSISQEDLIDLQELISDMFAELKDSYVDRISPDRYDQVALEIIDQMKQIITSDPQAIYKIYQAVNSK